LHSSTPHLTIKSTVLNRFAEMGGVHFFRPGEIGDGTGDFQDAVVSAGAEIEFAERHAQQAFAFGVERDKGLDVLRAHLRVAADLAFGRKALVLNLPRLEDAVADVGGAFRGVGAQQRLVLDGGNFDVDVDAVEQRAEILLR